jgi:hypothetical protein
MSDEPRPAELNALENSLRSLNPAPVLNRDQLMFHAGQESMRRSFRILMGVAAGLVALLPLQAMLLPRSGSERVVYVTAPAPQERPVQLAAPVPPPTNDPAAYFHVRKQVLEKGAESLPPPPAAPAAQRVSLESLLDL